MNFTKQELNTINNALQYLEQVLLDAQTEAKEKGVEQTQEDRDYLQQITALIDKIKAGS